MARRIRTTKKLAQRIDLNYFKYAHPFRSWRTRLAIGIPLLATVWIVWMATAGDKEMYSSGPVAASHAVIGERCNVCHVVQPGSFREHVTDVACLACHDGPIHTLKEAVRGREVVTLECGDCHVEHRGAARLAATDDKNCAECHASLSLRGGTPAVVRTITGFNADHPEFAVLREKKTDPGTIKLNHEVHMKSSIRGPKGQAKLECDDCHRPPATQADAWPYGEPRLRNVAVQRKKPDPLQPLAPNTHMVPVKYAQACDACHQLEFDKRIQDVVPHGKLVEVKDDPQQVYNVARDFMEQKLREYLGKNPNAWRETDVPERRIPGKPVETKPAARSPQEWVAQRLTEADNLLWNKTCKLCHAVTTRSGSPVPQVAKSNMTVRWMPRTVFDHQPHRMLKCGDCHAATTSKDTVDVLMPGVQNCQQCHRAGRAENRCFGCHAYHDWSLRQATRGKYTIPELLRGIKPAAPAAQPATK